MKRIFKLLLLVLMVTGIIFLIINILSVDNMAMKGVQEGTVQSDGCYGATLNC